MATTVAEVCAGLKAAAATVSANQRTGIWTISAMPPKAKRAKRTGTRWPISLSAISIMYSHRVCSRRAAVPRNSEGSSFARNGRGDDARMSRRILNPCRKGAAELLPAPPAAA